MVKLKTKRRLIERGLTREKETLKPLEVGLLCRHPYRKMERKRWQKLLVCSLLMRSAESNYDPMPGGLSCVGQ